MAFSILVTVTRFIQAVPIPNQEASTIAEAYVRKIICLFGNPQILLTDQGTNFLSDLFKKICKMFKIKKIQTSLYHPQSNGALERSHRVLGDYLRNYASKDPTNWDIWVDYAVLCYNTTPHSATNYTPYELLFGFPARIPSAITHPNDISYTYDDYAADSKAKLQNGYLLARNQLLKAKEKSKNYYDKYTNPISLNIGDFVYLEHKNRTNKKLTSPYNGPYEVINLLGPVNTVIKIGNKLKTVHNNLLKLYVPNSQIL